MSWTSNGRSVFCPWTHTERVNGVWRRGDNDDLGVIVASNGQRMYKTRCRNCQEKSNPIPLASIQWWGIADADLVWEQVNTPTVYPPCSYLRCEQTPTEYHHFAPRNTFGDDADSWPCLPLCITHHREWHSRMDGYLWHRRGVA